MLCDGCLRDLREPDLLDRSVDACYVAAVRVVCIDRVMTILYARRKQAALGAGPLLRPLRTAMIHLAGTTFLSRVGPPAAAVIGAQISCLCSAACNESQVYAAQSSSVNFILVVTCPCCKHAV